MNLLLDTCALLALASGTLPPAARAALADAAQAAVSPVVVWEIAIKVKAGKLALPVPALQWVEALASRHRLALAPAGLDAALLCAAADLPPIHRDPFDRVLVASALRQNLPILTSDRTISAYPGVTAVW